MPTDLRRWRPPSFLETARTFDDKFWREAFFKDLDLTLRAAFDAIYGTQADYLGFRPAAEGKRLAWSKASVTGSKTNIATGLATVEIVQVSLLSSTALNEWVTYTLGAKAGQISLYVWKPTGVADTTPIPSTTARTVAWLASGT